VGLLTVSARTAVWRSPTLLLVLAAALVAVLPVSRRGAAQLPPAPREIHHIHGLALPRRDPEVLLIATHTGLVRIPPQSPPEWVGAPMDLMGFMAHPQEPEVVYASGHPDLETYRREKVGMLGLLLSRDGGQTWRSVAATGQADFHALTYTPRDGGQLYGWNVGEPPGLVRVSATTWKVERLAARGLADVLSVSAGPDAAGRLLAGTKQGLMVSRDAGATWERVAGFPVTGPVTAVKHHVLDPRIVYAFAAAPGAGLLRSRDAAATWEQTGFAADPRAAVIAMAVGPGDHLALATVRSDVVRSRDAGRTWLAVVERGRPASGTR